MKKIVLVSLILALFLSPITQTTPTKSAEISRRVPVPLSPPYHNTRSVRFVVQSNVTFVNRGKDSWYLTESDRAMSLFMNNTWQTVLLIRHSYPLETITEDDDGNPIAILDLQRSLEPGENVSYSVSYHVLSKPRTIDIVIVAKAFGSCPGHKGWNPVADIDDNNKVELKDVFTVAKEFGKSL